CYRLTTCRGYLVDNGLGGARIGSVAGQATAGIIDDNLRSARRQQHGVRTAQPAAGARDDGHAIVESQFRHSRSELKTFEVTLFAPPLKQLLESVEARRIGIAESG